MGSKKKNFMTGALVLMVGGIIVKLIGALYKVPLANLVSGEAMAYYSNAYDIYTFMYIIATAAFQDSCRRTLLSADTDRRKRR